MDVKRLCFCDSEGYYGLSLLRTAYLVVFLILRRQWQHPLMMLWAHIVTWESWRTRRSGSRSCLGRENDVLPKNVSELELRDYLLD